MTYVNELPEERQRAIAYTIRRVLQLEGLKPEAIEEAVANAMKSKYEDLSDTLPSKCNCGCDNHMPIPPYESNGKWYSSAYCILRESRSCSYCGGAYKGEFDPSKHDFECRCNFSALDGGDE